MKTKLALVRIVAGSGILMCLGAFAIFERSGLTKELALVIFISAFLPMLLSLYGLIFKDYPVLGQEKGFRSLLAITAWIVLLLLFEEKKGFSPCYNFVIILIVCIYAFTALLAHLWIKKKP